MVRPGIKSGSLLMCSFGMAPRALALVPVNRTANVQDSVPIHNVGPFGMCRSMANPAVAAASAAAMGVPTPAACTPACAAWAPGDPMTIVHGAPALTPQSQLLCTYGGVISIVRPTLG